LIEAFIVTNQQSKNQLLGMVRSPLDCCGLAEGIRGTQGDEMFCSQCGGLVPEACRFCGNCGAPIQAAAPTPVALIPGSQQVAVKAWSLSKWYRTVNQDQRVVLLLASVGLVFLYGAGLVPLTVLLYLHLGEREELERSKSSET
jgi:hypothetical protein